MKPRCCASKASRTARVRCRMQRATALVLRRTARLLIPKQHSEINHWRRAEDQETYQRHQQLEQWTSPSYSSKSHTPKRLRSCPQHPAAARIGRGPTPGSYCWPYHPSTQLHSNSFDCACSRRSAAALPLACANMVFMPLVCSCRHNKHDSKSQVKLKTLHL